MVAVARGASVGAGAREPGAPFAERSTIAATAHGVVVAACLRNASAVAAWLSKRYASGAEPVTVIAALAQRGTPSESPEAAGARAVYEATLSVPDAVRRCASGVELATTGFGDDVDVAIEVDASSAVPVLVDSAFTNGATCTT